MYLAYDMLVGAAAQQPFTSVVAWNPAFIKYRSERDASAKKAIDAALALATLPTFEKIMVTANVFKPFKHAVHITSSVNCPASAYFPF